MANATISLEPGDALLIIDVQNDFLPGGALAVEGGNEVIEPLNRYIRVFVESGLEILATRDWHPRNHGSFVEQGGSWPPHCVQKTEGAAFSDELDLRPDTPIASKGMAVDDDDYSNFSNTELDNLLQERDVRRLFVGGIATDYCVRDTVLDALERGYGVIVLADAIRGVEVNPGDVARAEEEMKAKGARFITLEQIQ